jgi:cell wall-associated NlpC family hydrolase
VYPGSERAYHNGIYIGDGKIIHAPRPGRLTEVRAIAEIQFGHIVRYTRIIQSAKIDEVTFPPS